MLRFFNHLPTLSRGHKVFWCLSALLELAFLIAIILLSLKYRRNIQTYAVVFDAGSVHTTVNVYEYPGLKRTSHDDPIGDVKEVISCEINPIKGITDPSVGPEIGEYLFFKNTCMMEEVVGSTPVFDDNVSTWFVVGATAGMRSLQREDPKKAKFLMDRLRYFVSRFPKAHGYPNVAEILTAKEEGKYGWLSVNYLLNGLDLQIFDKQVGTLDLGGFSSEITFGSSLDSNAEIDLANNTLPLYTRSDECYGQAEALKRYYVTLIKDKFLEKGNFADNEQIDAPCQPGSEQSDNYFSLRWVDLFKSECTDLVEGDFKRFVDEESSRTYDFIGRANTSACYSTIARLFDREECGDVFTHKCFASADSMPEKPKDFYAFSTYYFTGALLNLDMSKSMLLGDARDKTNSLCSQRLKDHPLTIEGEEHVQNECFRAAFMSTLLETGYGLNSSEHQVKVVDKIQGQTVDWTLGYTLATATNWPADWEFYTPKTQCYWVVTAVCVYAFVFFLYLFVMWVVTYEEVYRPLGPN